MATVKLQFPALAQQLRIDELNQYQVSPVFLSSPIASHTRFDNAIRQFEKEIKYYFRGYQLSRKTADELLWFLFDPELIHFQYPMSFSMGNQFVQGKFDIIGFELQGKWFGLLPAFNHYMFMLSPEAGTGRKGLIDSVERIIPKLLKQIKQKEKNNFDVEEYFAQKGSFITHVSLNVFIEESDFSFTPKEADIFSMLGGGDGNFNGAVEIEKVGFDLNARYPNELKEANYREELVDRIYHAIYNSENAPLVIVGKTGVGRESLLHQSLRQFLDQAPSAQATRLPKIWYIDPTRIIAGMKYIGWWQRRFEAILQYLLDRPGDKKNQVADKMLVTNPVALVRIGKSRKNSLTLSDLLKPYLEKRQLQVIMVATPAEWDILQEKDRRFSDLFQVIRVEAPSAELAFKMILHRRRTLEAQYGSTISIQAIQTLVSLQRNFLRHKPLPGSVMKLLNQLAIQHRYSFIDSPEVLTAFRQSSGLSLQMFDETNIVEPGEVDRLISSKLIGQPDAVKALADLIHHIKAKLSPSHKPLGSYLFIGPTGVGKTQAAKVLSEYLLGNEKQLIRFDMNEYVDGLALQRLVGNEQQPEGQLTGKVRFQSFGVILFDEIEKAHPAVLDLLLQVLDDGRLTDALGRTVDFSNMVIIMTSNIGASQAASSLGFDTAAKDQGAIYRKAVENHFRPEFINRIDRIVVFNALQLEHILNIAQLQIKSLLQRDGFVRRTTLLNISKDALHWVARRGYDSKMGGRALKRQIEKDLTTLSANQLVKTTADQPILFDILLEEDQLVPIIHPLQFVEQKEDGWMPDLPDENTGGRFYGKLLREVEHLEQRVRHREEERATSQDALIVIGNEKGENLDWQYYDFKDRVIRVKENITQYMLGFRNQHFREAPAIPLRLKSSTVIPRRNDSPMRVFKENLRDRLFQQEALREIEEQYQYGNAQFDSITTEFLRQHLDVAFLQLLYRGFEEQHSEKLTLRFRSCIRGQGKEEIDFLVGLYQMLFDELDIKYEIQAKKRQIIAESFSLSQLIQGEQGLHLFYRSHQNPIPIELQLIAEGESPPERTQITVIRLYEQGHTLTDLRSGFTNAVNLTATEFMLLVYAGITR